MITDEPGFTSGMSDTAEPDAVSANGILPELAGFATGTLCVSEAGSAAGMTSESPVDSRRCGKFGNVQLIQSNAHGAGIPARPRRPEDRS